MSGGPARALDPQTRRELAEVLTRPTGPVIRSRLRVAGDGYSRRVAFLKRMLPAFGVMLLLLVAVWPRLVPLLERVRLGIPLIDLREARELRMLNPRYAGIDRYNRPFVVTSAVGRQIPNRDDLMSLERPRAKLTLHSGASVVMTAAVAIYQSQAQLLDLFDDVNLVHQNGTRFVTRRAHVNVAAETAEGHDPVVGNGPSGNIAAEGFRVLDKGDTIIFTGQSHLLLKGTKPADHPAEPPALPAEVAAAAAQVEAAATAPGNIGSEPSPVLTGTDGRPAPAQPGVGPRDAPRSPDARAKRVGGGAGRRRRYGG